MPRSTKITRSISVLLLLLLAAALAIIAGCQLIQVTPKLKTDLAEPDGKLTMVAFDVGQADSILVLAPSGKTMLVDAGNSADDAKRVILPFLRRHGIKRLDYLVLTHPHQDHVGGMPTILRDMEASTAVLSGEPYTNSAYRQLLSIIRERKITAIQARQGVPLDLGPEVGATILNPPESFFENVNDNSVVIRIAWREVSLLLTGDAETDAENSILQSRAELRSTILKVGHHGSGTSSSPRFLDAVKPKYAVISAGAGNEYGHPHKRTLDKLSSRNVATFRTDQNGTVVFTSDGSNVEVATEK